MKRTERPQPPPAERVEDLPRILAALTSAVQEALARHKRAGHSVAVWQDGRVVLVPPEEIPAAPDRALRLREGR